MFARPIAVRADEFESAVPEAGPANLPPPPDAYAALEKPRVRKVAVPRFSGASANSLRQAVLDVLSAHTDLELIGQPDLEVVARRIGAKISEPQDRARLSAELGLYAWFDADGDKSVVRVTDAGGEVLCSMKMRKDERFDTQIRKRMWQELGRCVSDEGMRQFLVGYRTAAAMQKLQAQEDELAHQRELAEKHAKQLAQRLEAMKTHARARLLAEQTEITHQSELASERIRREQKEAAKQAEAARQAELARQQELARQAEAARKAEIARQQELARQAEAARQAERARQNAYASQGVPPQAGYGYPPPAAPPVAYAPPPPSGRFGGGAMPGAGAPPPAPSPPAYAPAPAPPVEPQPGEVPGISPETRQWLLEHRQRQR